MTPEPLSPNSSPPRRVLGVAALVLVCALAFLLASTPARNSDLLLHLASGRALVRGQGPNGIDPFASTTAGVFWVNHSWLGDLALYGLYELRDDGRALVIAKAVGLALLAGLFFLFRRRGAGWGVVAFAAAAAVVALGPWLTLQPALFSLPGVVLTLYLLEGPSLADSAAVERARSQRWLLVPLFALWANLDAWFLLGPALVGLYAVGELLRRPRREFRALAVLTLAGLAACLLTPYHYRTFAWPTPLGLSHAERVLMGDPIGQGLVVPAFAAFRATAPALASPGGWAYCLLLAAGLVSFALRGRALHPGRLLAWLALAALSLYQARTIPFFAVAAGPILALNLQEWGGLRETRKDGVKESKRWKLVSILLVSSFPLLLVCLPVLAWPGWLQPAPHQPRAWAVEQDKSLVQLAQTLSRWHADGKFRPDRCALTFSPEVGNYLAWFCPEERGFLDSRWPVFDGVADDYVAMRRSLLRTDAPGPDPALGPLLDAHRVDRIILHDSEFGRTSQVYRSLLLDGDEWELLAIEGGSALFGRRGDPSSPPWPSLDLRRAAYHPAGDSAKFPDAPRAPEAPRWFDPFVRARTDRSSHRAAAALYLIYFDVMAGREQARLETQWVAALATGLLAPEPRGGAAGTAATLAARLDITPLVPPPPEGSQPAAGQFMAAFLGARDRGPPEALLLAVRAARRALAANPDDAGAFLLLGEAYLRLSSQTREPSWQNALPLLGPIRRAQALTALEQAVTLRPDLEPAHALLAQVYFEQGQMDRALDHLQARLRLVERETAGGADANSALRDQVAGLEALVRRSEKIYAANTEGKTAPSEVRERALVAARHGLSRKALEMLLQSYPAIFGKAGTQTQLDWMLQAGRAYEVRAWLDPELESLLGFSPYHSLRAQAQAACGDYAEADKELELLSEQLREVGVARDTVLPVREAVALQVGRAVLAGSVFDTGPAGLAAAGFQQYEVLRPVGVAVSLLRQRADSEVLRGVLALECGAVETARVHLRAALDVWRDNQAVASGAGMDFPSRLIAQHEMSLLE